MQEQSLRGLTDNIFRQLAVSEYVVFVDFKREQFANSAEYRGSLFTHQELAVAAFLDLEVLAFQEEGVRQLDGMIRFLQANAFRFDDRASLPQLVTAKVKERGWSPVWRKTLRLERDPTQFVDAESVDAYGRPAGVRRFFQGNVMNRHRSMVAAHAYVYLDRLVRVSDGEALPLKTIELKWAGYIYPNAVIRPGFPREFDCCWVHHDFPSQARFAVFADSPEYSPVINGPGQFHLRFTAVQSDLSRSRWTCPSPSAQRLTRYASCRPMRRDNREIDNIPLLYPVCTAWERTPWRAAQRAAWEALKRSGEDK